MKKFKLETIIAADLENIARGIYGPLQGFIVRKDFESVLNDMRLANDIPWTIPIVLDVEEPEEISEGMK